MRLLLPTALIFGALGIGSAAQSDTIWQRAIDKDRTETLSLYEAALTAGDETATQAAGRSINAASAARLVDQAITSYRSAAKLRPDQGEPYYRIGTILNHFFFDCLSTPQPPPTCSPGSSDEVRAQQLVDAYDAFEQRSPLDPRVTQILNERAIMRTKLVANVPPEVEQLQRMLARRTLPDQQRKDAEVRLAKLLADLDVHRKKLLEGARKDYQAMLDHADSLSDGSLHTSYGNLAETLMMLGNMDEALEAYRESIRRAHIGFSTEYGYAVALDRDEQTGEAMRILRFLKKKSLEDFEKDIADHLTFFVPTGEEEYYLALAHEAFDDVDEAIEHWNLYLKSGAHPQFQPRAKAHLDALVKKRRTMPPPVPPPDPFQDYP